MIDLPELLDKGRSFIAEKGGGIFYSSKKEGLFPLVECLTKHKDNLGGSSAADKIVGIAAARLLVFGKVKEVFSLTISEEAKDFLIKNNIKFKTKNLVKNILNKNKTDKCPMEILSKKFDDTESFYSELKRLNNI